MWPNNILPPLSRSRITIRISLLFQMNSMYNHVDKTMAKVDGDGETLVTSSDKMALDTMEQNRVSYKYLEALYNQQHGLGKYRQVSYLVSLADSWHQTFMHSPRKTLFPASILP